MPVRFIRNPGMQHLPTPVSGGSIDELRPLVNLPDDNAWILFIGWMIAALYPRGPYPVLIVNGEQGSAKSTLCRFARALIDPNKGALRRPPRDDRNLMIAATNSWVVAYDNLSDIPRPLSDTLCMLATGGGLGARELYSDGDEKLFDAVRPVMLNGIDDLAPRSDLRDRAVHLTLQQIPDDRRQDEDELYLAFERVRSRVLGALLDAVSAALRNRQSTELPGRPRMARFAGWVTAAEQELGWEPGTFMAAYMGNRADASGQAVEAAAIGPPILALMESQGRWNGTASELLADLEAHHTDERTRARRDWPRSPKAMGNALRRIAPNLRAVGVQVTFLPPQGRKKRRLIVLEYVGEESAASAAWSANPPGRSENHDRPRPVPGNCGASAARPPFEPPLEGPRETATSDRVPDVADHADHADRISPAGSEEPGPLTHSEGPG